MTPIDGLRARYCRPASTGLAISLALPLASVAAQSPLDALLDKARHLEAGENFHALSVLGCKLAAHNY